MAKPTLLLCIILSALGPATANASPSTPDGIDRLLRRLERVLESGVPARYVGLLSSLAERPQAEVFAAAVMQPRTTRVVVREREREPLFGTLPGDGFQLTVEVLIESGKQAQLSTWRLDVKRLAPRLTETEDGEWGIVFQKLVGVLPTIHRLMLSPGRQFTGHEVVVVAEDLRISVHDANIFIAEAAGGTTAAVIVGRGALQFSPSQPAERGQVRLFGGGDTLETPVEAVVLRFPPNDLQRHVQGTVVERPVDQREWKRADEVFRQEVNRSFSLDLGDLSDQPWSLLPMAGDVLAEIRTRRFGNLTYTRSSREAEDISLFDRSQHRNIAVYASADQLARRGHFYSEDDDAEYRVLSYDIDASFDPGRKWLEGSTRLSLRVQAPAINTLTLRLADQLVVKSVVSREYGRLLAVRVRGQNSVVVSLPVLVPRDINFSLNVTYEGVAMPQPVDHEAIDQLPQEQAPEVQLEESFLYSNNSYWYPQAPNNDYATATIRVRVPTNYSCVASGELVETTAAERMTERSAQVSRRFTFIARQPARYFACLITPLVQAAARVLNIERPPARAGEKVAPPTGASRLTLDVKTNPRLQSQARSIAESAGDILQFYASLIGDTPYGNATVAAVEWNLPGGHSPAYMAVLNQPLPGSSPVPFRNDPAFFENYPEFFVAHELAHQWWGQAVGWKNYHEQWLSEGLAQYFAALYAAKLRGPEALDSIVRRFRQWGNDKSDQGPIYLGYRVGHVKGDSRVFRAVVYNKSAAVLHMLRRLVGDDAFFGGLRRFYATWRFKKAGTDDLRLAMEASSGRDLARFFERWIYDDRLPRLTFTSRVETTARGPEAVLRFDQAGELFDVPVTVTIEYADGRTDTIIVAVTERVAEQRVGLTGAVRKIEANRDGAALGTVK